MHRFAVPCEVSFSAQLNKNVIMVPDEGRVGNRKAAFDAISISTLPSNPFLILLFVVPYLVRGPYGGFCAEAERSSGFCDQPTRVACGRPQATSGICALSAALHSKTHPVLNGLYPLSSLRFHSFPPSLPALCFYVRLFFSSFRTPYLLTLAFFSHCCSAGMWRLCVPPAAPGREGGLWKRRWPWRLREKSWLIAQTRIISP